jgi:hypothetical protein
MRGRRGRVTPVEINQERSYAGEPGLVFAALIHAMGECAAQVVGVEEFGTMVLFSFPAANTPERERLSARVSSGLWSHPDPGLAT